MVEKAPKSRSKADSAPSMAYEEYSRVNVGARIVRIEAVLPPETELENEDIGIGDEVQAALDSLQSVGSAEVIEEFFVSNSEEDAAKILRMRARRAQ